MPYLHTQNVQLNIYKQATLLNGPNVANPTTLLSNYIRKLDTLQPFFVHTNLFYFQGLQVYTHIQMLYKSIASL